MNGICYATCMRTAVAEWSLRQAAFVPYEDRETKDEKLNSPAFSAPLCTDEQRCASTVSCHGKGPRCLSASPASRELPPDRAPPRRISLLVREGSKGLLPPGRRPLSINRPQVCEATVLLACEMRHPDSRQGYSRCSPPLRQTASSRSRRPGHRCPCIILRPAGLNQGVFSSLAGSVRYFLRKVLGQFDHASRDRDTHLRSSP